LAASKAWVRNPFGIDWNLRLLVPLGCGALLIAVSEPSPGSLAVSLPFVLAGEALRIWTAGHLHKTRELTISGPYAFLRHPLYAGTLLIGLGFCLMAGWHEALVAVPAFLAFFFGYYLPYKERREAGRLERRHGADYEAYRSAVRPLLPRLSPWRPATEPKELQRWDPERVRDNDEVGTALVVCGTVFLFLARWWSLS
jgi:protein-S-isoprenylcysteine O-methyltransferase Ste14